MPHFTAESDLVANGSPSHPTDPLGRLLSPDDVASRGVDIDAGREPLHGSERLLIGDRVLTNDAASVWRVRWDRVRTDPRASWVLLLLIALIAGFVWYRMGIADAPTPAADRATTTVASAGEAAGGSEPNGADASGAASTSGGRTTPPVVVHVAGAVLRPGVVQLAAGSRVVDALAAAGGAQPDADVNRLNLAAKLVDGQRIAVPKLGEPAPAADPGTGGGVAPGAAGSASGAGSAPTPDNPLDLNTATAVDLEALPGIGPSLAQAIITERTRRGGFESVNDLRAVRGIGDGRFADIKDLVRV